MPYERLAADVDPAEDQELRRMEGAAGVPWGEPTEEDQGPAFAQTLEQEQLEEQMDAQEREEAEMLDEDAEEDAADEPEIEQPRVPPLPEQLPPDYPAGAMQDLLVLAQNIQQDAETRRGIRYYRTYWKQYAAWFVRRHETLAAPTCPITGYVFLIKWDGVRFMTDMAFNGGTAQSVCNYRSHPYSPFLLEDTIPSHIPLR